MAGAIPDDQDQGESWAPPYEDNFPSEQDQAVPPTQNAAAQPGVIPDVGVPAVTLGGLGSEFEREAGEGVTNLENSAPVRFARDAYETPGAPSSATHKGILQYLMGADAADPSQAQSLTQSVKAAKPDTSDSDANLLAVHKATEMGGPAAGWAMLQYNRAAYNRKQSFALAALNGVDGKTGDLQAAAKAASQASENVLDGSHAQFVADPGGKSVTATVKPPGAGRTISVTLTPQQFGEYLNPAGAGQWDHVMSGGGIAGTLHKVATSQVAASNAPSSSLNEDRGTQPSSTLPPEYQNTAVGPDQFPAALEHRADDIFGPRPTRPLAGMMPANLQARVQWEQQQEQPYEQRKANIIAAQAKANSSMYNAGMRMQGLIAASRNRAQGQIQGWGERADATRYAADQRTKSALAQAQIAAARLISQNNNAGAREKGLDMRAEINAVARTANPGDDISGKVQEILQRYGVAPTTSVNVGTSTPPAAAASQPQQQAAPAAQRPDVGSIAPPRPANVPAGAKFYQGKWYTRGPNGEAVPVQ